MNIKSNYQNSNQKEKIKLDPRIRFIFFIMLGVITFMESNRLVFIFNCLIVILLYFFSKKIKQGLLALGIMTVLIGGDIILGMGTASALAVALQLVVFLVGKMLMFIIIGNWVFLSMQTGDFLSAMQTMRLPKGLIITFSVIFRYAPSVWYEFWYIKGTMKLRGIAPNFKNLITHPIKTIEYAFVPLIIRSMTIADRLSASAMTRGLDLENKRSSYNLVKLRLSDYLICLLVCSLSIGSVILKNVIEGGGL